MNRIQKLKLYLPLIFFQSYLFGTVLLFAAGPWQWIVADSVKLYCFLLAAQLMIGLGYMLAVRKDAGLPHEIVEPRSGLVWFRISLAANILLAAPTAWARSNAWVPNVVAGLQNPGAVYMESVERLTVFGPHVYVEYARIILAIIILPMVPLTIIYWRSLGRFERFLASVTIAWYLSIFIAVGQNKGLADAIATWAVLIIAGCFFRRLPLPSMAVKLAAAYTVALVLFFSYFGMTQLMRDGGAVAGAPGTLSWHAPDLPSDTGVMLQSGGETPTRIQAYPDHLVARIAPDFVRNAYESFARYLGQGYQAFAFSLDLAHPSTLGLGNSMFLARNADRIFKTDFFERQSLPGILEQETGWSRQMQWHSIYSWIASDAGLPGTLLVMGVLGFVLAKSWIRTIRTADPLWATMLYMMLIIFFYIPANNQIMQSGETAVGFVALSTLILGRWLMSRFSGLVAMRSARTT